MSGAANAAPPTGALDCGHAATPQGCAAGYARDDAGRTLCYPCADAQQRETLRTAKRIVLYVSSERNKDSISYGLTTWTGGVLGKVWLGARHPWSRERNYVTATDVHGGKWHGTGAPGMYCSLRRCKQ